MEGRMASAAGAVRVSVTDHFRISIRGAKMIRIQTILYPTDFSVAAEHALEVAHSLARDHRAKLVLLNVTDVLPVREVPLSEYDLAGVVNEARRQLEVVAAPITDLPVEIHAVVGEPAQNLFSNGQNLKESLRLRG
jgi:hypothetical protein